MTSPKASRNYPTMTRAERALALMGRGIITERRAVVRHPSARGGTVRTKWRSADEWMVRCRDLPLSYWDGESRRPTRWGQCHRQAQLLIKERDGEARDIHMWYALAWVLYRLPKTVANDDPDLGWRIEARERRA